VRELAEGLSAAVAGLAPSLVKYEQPSAYRREAWPRLRAEAAALAAAGSPEAGGEVGATTPEDAEVRLVSTTPDPDGTLAAVLLFAAGRGSMAECRHLAGGLDFAARRALLLSHCGPLGPHDPILREYEHVDAVFELVLSASAFAQLKRHRMATITALPYDPALGVTVPPALAEAGLEREFRSIMERSEECARRIAAAAPGADPAGAPPPWAAYALTNAHRRRVLVKMNARELYHLSRLREDAHAQWDIRRLAARMVALARARMPLTLALAAGKDRFAARRESELS